MSSRLHVLSPALLGVILLALIQAAPAMAEVAISPYLGGASTLDSAVRLTLPGGTDLSFQDVSWRGDSLSGPMYYGIRFTFWIPGSRRWGLALDFTHAKMFAQLGDTVPVSGTREGNAVSGREILGDTFRNLSFSHGHNLLFINGQHRWLLQGKSARSLRSRIQPYVGFGLGAAYPHVEVQVPGSGTEEYQWAGPAAQVLGGAHLDVVKWFGLFAEYKLSYADMDVALAGGGSLEVQPWTHHLVLGASFTLGKRR